MGLFSKKKKTPKVPFPEGKFVDERSLSFSPHLSADKVIEPDALKKAAGVHAPPEPPTLTPPPPEPVAPQAVPMPPSAPSMPVVAPTPLDPTPVESEPIYAAAQGPLFVKKEVYVDLLEGINEVVKHIGELRGAGNELAQSEYNEEHEATQLKKKLKSVHDKMLQVDSLLFKVTGE